MRYFTLLCIFFASHLLYAETLTEKIDALIEHALPQAQVGIVIQDPQSGKIIYERNAQKLLSPASNIKILTAAAALYQLGPDYYYSTVLSQKDNNLYITFSGNPALKTSDLKKLLQTLKTQKITHIHGNIVLDTSQFSAPYHAAGVSYEDLGWYYAAPSTAVILNDNAVAYQFISAQTLGGTVQLKPSSAENNLTIINELITVNKEQAKEHCSLNIETKENNSIRLYGCLAQSNKPITMRLAIPDPVFLAKQIIQTNIKEENITLQGHIIEGKTPSDAQKITVLHSDNLLRLITHMLQESDNLYADSVTKTLGFYLTGEGSYKQGVFAIKHILSEHTHLNMQQLELSDGLGTRFNYVSPTQLATLLQEIYQNPKMYPLFFNALPHMGLSGNLKDRLSKSVLNNKVIAKTGTMHDMSALSGYLYLANGKTLIFSIISNEVHGGIQKAKNLEDKILLTLYQENL
ncbi:MAG: D-alanyl-D-alanine carboxypeptidase/D-alanyl-D-alanine-endopeptidase [Legionellaceae bacterium]|nr:D-alanyl-D-alanine carboxypeptidase/D-alanyl-D-alanine-endopeptidase [Legionellaceae bacterium]